MNRHRILCFAAAFLLVAAGFELGARRIGPGSTQIPGIVDNHRLALADRGSDVEVLFTGDSSMGADLDPDRFNRETGLVAYNLWLPAVSASSTEELVVDFGLAGTTPDVVVVGVTGRMFNETLRLSLAGLQSEVSQTLPWRAHVRPSLLTSFEQRAARWSALIRYRTRLREPSNWISGLRGGSDTTEDATRITMSDLGQLTLFLDRRELIISEEYEAGERAALADFEPSGAEFDALKQLIRDLHAEGIEVYVVNLPTNNEVFDQFYPNGAADVADFRRELAARLEDEPATFLDLTDLGNDASLFADGNHMNRSGSDIFTDRMADELS